jgi:SAM-dependent methyltransferase
MTGHKNAKVPRETLMSRIARALPVRLKNSLKVLLGRSLAIPLEAPGMFTCPVCRKARVDMEPIPLSVVRELDKHEHIHSLFQWETCNLEHYSCSRCGASDRDRLYALHLSAELSDGHERRLLDIAPSAPLTAFLKGFPHVKVRTADLNMPHADDKVDVTNMNIYADHEFDVFICSHVLEHVPDDAKAIRELYRILKPGGWGIAMVPIFLGISRDYEDPGITDVAGRWKHYGKDDHLRVYSRNGFVERLQAAGFDVQQLGASHFGAHRFRDAGIHPRSVLYIARKRP